MFVERLEIPGLMVLRPKRLGDARGWFAETFSEGQRSELGLPTFVQENESSSANAGTVRGLHFQRAPKAQAKLVRCVVGAVFDVAVDIRPTSSTFGKHVSMRLDAERGDQLYVPAGFAHGFCTLEPHTLVQYKVSTEYSPKHEGGILWNDPALAIKWPVTANASLLSEKDRLQWRFSDQSFADV
jgi:dTDP-4-dehydrorhamnose 3,5-epimerase